VAEPRRVKVEGDLFHPRVPPGAIYVGRSGPGLPASKYANPFRLKLSLGRAHSLRGYLEAAILEVTAIRAITLREPRHDMLPVITPAVAVTAYRHWLNDQPHLIEAARSELAGRDIACWCPEPEPGLPDLCHGRPLLAVSNGWEMPGD
jgi:hypothetical protein